MRKPSQLKLYGSVGCLQMIPILWIRWLCPINVESDADLTILSCGKLSLVQSGRKALGCVIPSPGSPRPWMKLTQSRARFYHSCMPLREPLSGCGPRCKETPQCSSPLEHGLPRHNPRQMSPMAHSMLSTALPNNSLLASDQGVSIRGLKLKPC